MGGAAEAEAETEDAGAAGGEAWRRALRAGMEGAAAAGGSTGAAGAAGVAAGAMAAGAFTTSAMQRFVQVPLKLAPL